MKPLKLTMHYFGPYEDTTIDFTRIDASPLYLIAGDTGSGKTTIFDAMCVALYGNASGGVVQQLKSAFGIDEFGVRQGEIGGDSARRATSRIAGGSSEVVPITLKVEGKDRKVENVEVKAEVRDLTAEAPMDHKHHH